MSDLATLLDLQAHDVRLDQLRHRRAALAERGVITGLGRERAALEATLAAVRAERDTVARAQKRLEDDVALVAAKVVAEDKKLYSGTVTAPKELQAIQDEIAALQRRQHSLEDDILVQMEAAEPLDEALAAHEADHRSLSARLDEVAASLRDAEAVIDAEALEVQAERDALAATVPEPLLGEYEQLRRSLGGVAVAKLEGSSCRGCHLQLSALEVGRIRRLDRDALVHCEECGRILVR
jgi:predicted  nucleic acid-binding Zn-ribbon protein